MKNKIKLSGAYRTSLTALIFAICIIMALNAILIRHTESQRIETEGQRRLSSIASKINNSLYHSECLLNSVAMQIEQIISMGGDTSVQLEAYFTPETISYINSESNGSCFSAYAAYKTSLLLSVIMIIAARFVLQ